MTTMPTNTRPHTTQTIGRGTTLRTTFATYTLGKQLGQGTHNTVHEAKAEDGTTVAIKILRPDQAAQRSRVKRFKNEINFGLTNKHQNIVTIIDHGITDTTEDGRPFYVMPRLTGSLRDRMKAGIPPSDVLPLFDQLLSGIEAAHKLGTTHRDLKPENILYDTTNSRLLIADFGIAHFNEEHLATSIDTKPGDRLANDQYAAPEQRQRNTIVDHRADIYALGLILNELFTTTIPLGKGHPTIANVAPNLAYLDDLVDTMLNQNPARRPQTIDAIKLELAARKDVYVTRQQLDKARNVVISATDVTDPIVTQGIAIRETDIDNRPEYDNAGYLRQPRLIVHLTRPANERWFHHLQNADNVPYDTRHPPAQYTIDKRHQTLAIELAYTDGIKRIIEQTTRLITRATARYAEELQQQQAKLLEAQRREKADEIRRLEERQELLRKIRL